MSNGTGRALAVGTGCALVTGDLGLYNLALRYGACAVYLPQWYLWSRNTWDQVTRVVKLAALCARGRWRPKPITSYPMRSR